MTLHDSAPSAELDQIARYLAGDQKAFEELVARYNPGLRRHLGRIFRVVEAEERHALVEDLLQEAWLRVHRHLPNFSGEKAKFSTWLYVITGNLARNVMRDTKRRKTARWPRRQDPDTGEYVDVEIEDTRIDSQPDLLFERREEHRQVSKYLRRLPKTQREVVSMRFGQGLSYEEIGVRLGVCVGTVKSRLHRARVALGQFKREHEYRPRVS